MNDEQTRARFEGLIVPFMKDTCNLAYLGLRERKDARPSMNCEACQDFIDAYVDNELDAAATIPVKRHLRDCPKCRQRLEARNAR